MEHDNISIVKRFYRLDIRQLAFVKFIVESYDGIAMLRTLNAGCGEIEVMAPECNLPVLDALIDDLRKEINIVQIKKPVDYFELVV